ncbi:MULTISPECIES: glycosyltransferase family 2 protein [unclassified Bradyrhizobium]|uniref:glycosyltransferase family 2 protein n=1 Tax=unclassified Bradyrhizobium TaxID=2631580 RepID=UPI002916E60A|nr:MULTISPECIES: glycosyltransferase family 2 protein [unclassified Bradyrhizobium]
MDFSIVIPTLNRIELLKRAVNSVLRQSYRSYEVIIVDDGSRCPPELLNVNAETEILVIVQEKTKGAAAARNAGIEAASGSYISFLDDDDEYFPDFLLRTKTTIEAADKPAFSWCGAQLVHYDSWNNAKAINIRQPPGKFLKQEDVLTETLSIGTGYGLTVRADCFRSLGTFDTSFRMVEDMELFFRLLSSGMTPTIIRDILVRIHHHNGDRLTDRKFDEERAAECERLFDMYRSFINERPSVRRQLESHIDRLRDGSGWR